MVITASNKMKSHLLILTIFAFVTACSDSTSNSQKNTKIDSLNTTIKSLRSEIADQQVLIDSLTNIETSNSTIDSLKYLLKRKDVTFSALTQAQVGEFQRLEEEDENGTWAFEYRIEIYGSEIYKSVYLTKIEYYSESVRRIGSTYEIDIEGELGLFGESTNSLELVKWTSPEEFQLATRDSTYNLEIIGPTNVRAIAKNP